MSLTRIQKLFVKLSNTQRKKWSQFPRNPMRRRMRRFKKFVSDGVRVSIINAVTGEKTTAKALEDTTLKLKKWLKLRNLRAQFLDMTIVSRSTLAQLPEEQWANFPVIVKVGTYQVPYVIDRRGDIYTVGNRTSCTVFLKAVSNVDYLSVIAEKKKIVSELPKLPAVKKEATKKKKKQMPKRRLADLDDEDYFGA